jgi:hypothetical protein
MKGITMPRVTGYLQVVNDPGSVDNTLPGIEGGIDNSLPPVQGPVDPGFGYPLPPVRPSHGLPWAPGHISGGPVRPTYPVDPGYGLPTPPTVWPTPPVGPDNALPIAPSFPIYIPPDANPDNSLPLPPGAVWPPLPPGVADGKLLCFAWIVGVGYRWAVIDTTLTIGGGPATPPPVASQGPGMPTQPIAPGGQPTPV